MVIIFLLCITFIYADTVQLIPSKSIIQITDNDIRDYSPVIHNNSIAWLGYQDVYCSNDKGSTEICGQEWDIFYWNGRFIDRITENALDGYGVPSLYNRTIVWNGWDGGLYYWDGAEIFRMTNTPESDSGAVSYHNGAIAWSERDGDDFEIFYATGLNEDADNDGMADMFDECDDDPNKTAPGQYGCGQADIDSDGDQIADCNDKFPNLQIDRWGLGQL